MPPKRPHDQISNGQSRNEKSSVGGSGGINNVQAQLEAAKARFAALVAKNATTGSQGATTSQTNTNTSAQDRPIPNTNGNRFSSSSSSNNGNPSNSSKTSSVIDTAAIQARINAAMQKSSHKSSTPIRHDSAKPNGIHPLLLNKSAGSSSTAVKTENFTRHIPPKFSTLNANKQSGNSPSLSSSVSLFPQSDVNPYLSANTNENEGEIGIPRTRAKRRTLLFNAPGRHIRAAEEARREAQMEALKIRIEEQARKAGLEELTAEERALRRPQPPGVEWWDQQFLPNQDSYDAVKTLLSDNVGKGKEKEDGLMLLKGEGSPIDIYIQHPIPIPAPSDKIKVESRGVMLTKKEMKKMRRMRRRAEQEDKRDRIKMGLQAPDPPKVKLANLMKVLTSEAVSDPTKVEARVRKEVAARQDQHEQTNFERKLTDEERKLKIEEQKQKDLLKGMFTLVFKVKFLLSPSHKFKVRKNAMQLGLTGMTLIGKDFSLIFVEGGQKAIKSYRHLMMNRIDWQDPGRPKATNDLIDEPSGTGTPVTQSSATLTLNEQDELNNINWSENYCKILFEGPIRDRRIEQGFHTRQCETDYDAKQALETKRASYWDLAKRDEKANEEE